MTSIDHDLSINECRSQLKEVGCRLIELDLLAESSASFMQGLIDSLPKPTVLFCDNGNKPLEWNRYVPMLEVGDFAAVHDWGSEFGPQNLDPRPDPFLKEEAEAIGSITRFFQVLRSNQTKTMPKLVQ